MGRLEPGPVSPPPSLDTIDEVAGSPHANRPAQASPATLVAGSGPRNWRGDPEEREKTRSLGWADPASLAWALTAADSGAGPPLHRGWALGSTPARDLGRKDGGEMEEEGGRERGAGR